VIKIPRKFNNPERTARLCRDGLRSGVARRYLPRMSMSMTRKTSAVSTNPPKVTAGRPKAKMVSTQTTVATTIVSQITVGGSFGHDHLALLRRLNRDRAYRGRPPAPTTSPQSGN